MEFTVKGNEPETIACEVCGKTFAIYPEKLKKTVNQAKCSDCGTFFTVKKVIDESSDSTVDIPAMTPDKSEPSSPDLSNALDSAVSDSPGSTDHPEQKRSIAAPPTAVDPLSPRNPVQGMGLTAKVTLKMLVVSLLPLLIFWGLTFKRTSERVEQEFNSLAQEITVGLTTQVDEWIDKNVRVMNAFSKLPAMVSMNREQQEVLLETMTQDYPWVYLAFTTDTGGMNIARSDGKPLKDYSDRSYYKQAIERKGLAWQNLIGKTSKKPALVLATPIKDGESIVGVLAIAMQIDAISQRIATWHKGNTGHAFLVDDGGKVVAHQIESYVQEQKDLSAHPLVQGFRQGSKGLQSFTDEKGQKQIGQAKATEYGWVLAIQQAEVEAYDILRQERRSAIILLSITVLLVLLFALYTGRQIVSPIRELTDVADRISVGELDVEVDIKSKDEIAALGDAIARMQDSIRMSVERLRRRRWALPGRSDRAMSLPGGANRHRGDSPLGHPPQVPTPGSQGSGVDKRRPISPSPDPP